MTPPCRLAGEGSVLEGFRAALATLPVTFGATGSDATTIAVVDGRTSSWWEAARGALSEAAAVIVHQPTADVDLGDASDDDGRIVLAQPWSGSPAGRAVPAVDVSDVDGLTVPAQPWSGGPVAPVQPLLGDEIRLITADFELREDSGRSLRDAATDLLTVALRPLPGAAELRTWRESGGSLIVTGTVGSAELHLTGVRSQAAPGGSRVAWRSVASTTRAALPAPGAAWPGSVSWTTAEGETRWDTGYVGYLRASLQEAVRVAAGGRCDDLNAFRRTGTAVMGVLRDPRYSGRWQTASTLLPSGSRTKAP